MLTKEEKKKRNCERAKEWYRADPRRAKNQHLRKYGITIDQYEYWSQVYGFVCHLCGNKCPSKRSLAVDHSHESGLVRGLLCINCNKGLGNFKDNIDLLKKAIEYLEDAEWVRKQVENALDKKLIKESVSEECGNGNESSSGKRE